MKRELLGNRFVSMKLLLMNKANPYCFDVILEHFLSNVDYLWTLLGYVHYSGPSNESVDAIPHFGTSTSVKDIFMYVLFEIGY